MSPHVSIDSTAKTTHSDEGDLACHSSRLRGDGLHQLQRAKARVCAHRLGVFQQPAVSQVRSGSESVVLAGAEIAQGNNDLSARASATMTEVVSKVSPAGGDDAWETF